MNIAPVLFNNFRMKNSERKNYLDNGYAFRTGILNHLTEDTISFSGKRNKISSNSDNVPGIRAKAKDIESMSGAINVQGARLACAAVDEPAKKVFWTLKKYMKPLIATANSPDAPICSGERGLKYRIKDVNSLRGKTAGREIRNLREVAQMGDISGYRITLRDSNPKNTALVLKQLEKAVKHHDLNIVEIENYLTSDGKSYAPAKAVKSLAAACNQNSLKVSFDKRIPSGYPAIHVGIATKEGYIFELQIMGRDVEAVKDVDDIPYKLLSNKGLEQKYKLIENALKPVLEGLTEEQKDLFMEYRRESFRTAFNSESKRFNSRRKAEFLPCPAGLPPELSYSFIAGLQELCSKNVTQK